MLTARSWCTGYSGLDMAVEMALGPFELLSVSDIKPASERLLAHRMPDVPNLGDMRVVDHTALAPADLMIGSWPCQPHSAAGKRLGEADPRDLWPEFARALCEARPAIFFGENVARIASNGELRRAVRTLADLGYMGAWRVLGAGDPEVGACHLRKRCWIVAVDPHAQSVRCWAEGRHDRPRAAELVTGPDAGAAGTSAGTGELENVRGPGSAGRLTLLPTPHQNATTGAKGGPNMRGSSGDLSLPSAVQTVNFAQYTEAVHRHENALGRPAPVPTQRGVRGGFQLSPRFVEWMMMLPPGWVTDVPDIAPRQLAERNAMISLLGDGVVPPQGAYAFRFLLDHLADRLSGRWAA